MGYALGIDVGTTFSAAAICRDQSVEVVAFETHRLTVPTVLFAEGEEVLFGTPAVTHGNSNPAGVAREFKRRLGDSVPLVLSGAPYAADHLVALFIRRIFDTVSDQLAGSPERVVVTHPANWTHFQLNLLSQALQHVGLTDVEFVSEPEAAACDFAATADVDDGQLVLVYDLGGGTFDVALLRRDGDAFTYVGEAAGVERLGGIDFDEAVFQHVLRHLPDEAIVQARSDPTGRIALMQLVRGCVEAKEVLSNAFSAEVPVVLPGYSTTVRLTRTEFEEMIRPMVGQTVDLVRQVMARAGIDTAGLSEILLIGGASRTPLVSELVGQALGATVRIDAHPKLVVARGAARRAGAPRPTTGAKEKPRSIRRSLMIGGGLLAFGLVAAGAVLVLTAGDEDVPVTVGEIELIGEASLESGFSFGGTTVGGLSGIAYDAADDVYYAISDDPNEPRFYGFEIDLDDGEFLDDDLTPVAVTPLLGADGQPAIVEADGIAFDESGTIFVCDEGSVAPPLRPPSIWEFDLSGTFRAEHPAPTWYHPTDDQSSGMAQEGGFSSLDAAPTSESMLIAAIERPLLQDASAITAADRPVVRILMYDTQSADPIAEYGYPLGDTDASIDSQPTSSVVPSTVVDHRLKELTALDSSGTVLLLEALVSEGIGTYRVYEAVLGELGDNDPSATLPEPVDKHLVVDFRLSGYPDRDYQAMTLGSKLADGRDSLIVVSDNNFVDDVPTQFLVFAVQLEDASQ